MSLRIESIERLDDRCVMIAWELFGKPRESAYTRRSTGRWDWDPETRALPIEIQKELVKKLKKRTKRRRPYVPRREVWIDEGCEIGW